MAPGWRDSESLPGTCFYFCGFYFCNLIFELVRRISTKFLFQTLFDKELPPSHSLQSHLISMLFSNRGYPKDDRINILSKIHFLWGPVPILLGLKQKHFNVFFMTYQIMILICISIGPKKNLCVQDSLILTCSRWEGLYVGALKNSVVFRST